MYLVFHLFLGNPLVHFFQELPCLPAVQAYRKVQVFPVHQAILALLLCHLFLVHLLDQQVQVDLAVQVVLYLLSGRLILEVLSHLCPLSFQESRQFLRKGPLFY